MSLAMKTDVAEDPGDVRLFRAAAVVADAKGCANAIEEARLRWPGRAALVDGEPGTTPRAFSEGPIRERGDFGER
jgi:hypothetical protein